MTNSYDAIVVGTRCAGAPLAMLLARKGYRVLAVDHATFPSDTISTHVVHPRAMASLARWGLAERLRATGCPPIHTYAFDFGAFTIEGAPGGDSGAPGYCPRRVVLDALLVEAAAEAGAELRPGFGVEELLIEDGRVVGVAGRSRGGGLVRERARVVIGADGRFSRVAEAVRAPSYQERAPHMVAYYAYWSGLPMAGRFETYARERRGFAAAPTHDGLTVVMAGWPYDEFAARKGEFERHYLESFALSPAFAERLRGARREGRIAGAAVNNFFRKPYGPGWALVGDAGYNKEYITAQGILDAFRDAESCAQALDAALSGARDFDEVMGEHQRARDEHVMPMYELSCQLAALAPPAPELQGLLAAVHGNPAAMNRFVEMNAGGLSPAEFFAPESVAAIMMTARERVAPAPSVLTPA